MPARQTAPRGRHAPPLEVRRDLQRRRLFSAASAVFARVGYGEFPDESQTLLVEIIGAGPAAIARRDRMLAGFAGFIDETNAADAATGGVARLASPEDGFGIVGAALELASRQLRTGQPSTLAELAPVIERVIVGLVQATPRA